MKEQGEDPRDRAMRSAEFVAFVAAALVIGALATDRMLPALAAIDDELRVAGSSPGQAAIGAFLLGMGLAQFLVGPIDDRYGRRPVFLGAPPCSSSVVR